MSGNAEALRAEFPDKQAEIERLLAHDVHFARLVEEYESISCKVHRAEQHAMPVDEALLRDLHGAMNELSAEIHRKVMASQWQVHDADACTIRCA